MELRPFLDPGTQLDPVGPSWTQLDPVVPRPVVIAFRANRVNFAPISKSPGGGQFDGAKIQLEIMESIVGTGI